MKFADQPFLESLYKTLFSTMYFRLLRVSEVAESIHAVKAKDVQIGANKNKFLIVLRTSKTHWKNMKLQLIKISATKCHGTGSFGWADAKLSCLYQLLRDYSAKRGGYSCDEEPLSSLRNHL